MTKLYQPCAECGKRTKIKMIPGIWYDDKEMCKKCKKKLKKNG